MSTLGHARVRKLVAQLVRLMSKPRPSYELFYDAEDKTPWFMVLCFPTRKDWDAYALCRVWQRVLLDMSAISLQAGDKRAVLLYNRMRTLVDIAMQTEPREGEDSDGKLHDDE